MWKYNENVLINVAGGIQRKREVSNTCTKVGKEKEVEVFLVVRILPKSEERRLFLISPGKWNGDSKEEWKTIHCLKSG